LPFVKIIKKESQIGNCEFLCNLQVLRSKYKWKKFYFLETGERWAVWGDMAYGHHIPRTTHRQKEPPPDFAELQR
jgi:hypothetical protein